MSRPSLQALAIGDPPGAWEALGFTVSAGGVCVLGGVSVLLRGGDARGILGWAVDAVGDAAVDGLAAIDGPSAPGVNEPEHPNGAVALDHVVVLTPDFDRTASALAGAGMELRRVRDAGGFRQGFRRLGPAILELVEARDGDPAAPARFWGLVVIVSDLEALASRLGPSLKPIRAAVQPGRRIATLSRDTGVSPPLAFMDPEPPRA